MSNITVTSILSVFAALYPCQASKGVKQYISTNWTTGKTSIIFYFQNAGHVDNLMATFP